MNYFSARQHQIKTARGGYTVVSFVCVPLEAAGFANGFSTRMGGVSRLPKNSLNLSDKNDSQRNVRENMKRFLESLGHGQRPVQLLDQIHSNKVFWAGLRSIGSGIQPKADALVANSAEIFVGIKSADCLPILLADPKTGTFAAVHAGWKGTLARIAEKTVRWLKEEKKIAPANLIAALGPAACGDCFEVGEDVAALFQKEFSSAEKFLKKIKKGRVPRYFVDTAAANQAQLLNLGLKKQNIYRLPFCTMHQNELFFSHRKESHQGQKEVGRQLAVIGLSLRRSPKGD